MQGQATAEFVSLRYTPFLATSEVSLFIRSCYIDFDRLLHEQPAAPRLQLF